MTVRWRILHVEDDPDIRMVTGLALGLDPSLSVRSVESGGAALALLAQGDYVPDLLLVDVMMPDMDGMRLIAEARALDGLRSVPAIVMTARARPGDVERYRAAGSLGLIVKPFDPVTLAARIRGMMADAV
ncbi:MAG TPA: response regulator [Sphingomonas sp.]|jgi:CheY-like chemotaxis protein|uniref:response regulator n=1 Tax=Sphingomonas sp. TaxID=28214 RepID=UPI002EDB054E